MIKDNLIPNHARLTSLQRRLTLVESVSDAQLRYEPVFSIHAAEGREDMRNHAKRTNRFQVYIYIRITLYMAWIFHHFSTWKKPFIQFASSTSRSRSSSSITFRSWKCAKTASSDMRTRRHGKAETTRMTRMDLGWCWRSQNLGFNVLQRKVGWCHIRPCKHFQQAASLERKRNFSQANLQDLECRPFFWVNCGDSKFLETSPWFLDASSWPTTSESCSAWVRPEAWKQRLRQGTRLGKRQGRGAKTRNQEFVGSSTPFLSKSQSQGSHINDYQLRYQFINFIFN